MTRLWKRKQLSFMSCPLSAYVVWLNTTQWLLTRHCADRCSALPFREGTHGGERTERESDTFTPRRQIARRASPHSLVPSCSWFSGVWFSNGEIQAGARDFAEDERRQRGQRAAHQNKRLWANPRLEKVEPLRRDVSGLEMDGLARTLHRNLNDVSWMSTSKAIESKWAHVSEKGGSLFC